jgi:hypothetical protein
MTNTLPEAEALAFLSRIEAGEVTLEPIGGAPEYFQCVIRYRSPCGWILAVFNDVGEWDYLEDITSPDGRTWDFSDAGPYETALQAYQPPDDVAENAYGFHWG